MLGLAALLVPVLGIVASSVYLYSSEWSTVGLGVLVALGALLSGGILGFLFGIPRTLQNGVNTNLEQISDWLTKILVGVVLIQFGAVTDGAGELFAAVGTALGDGEGTAQTRIAAGALVTVFTIAGFLIAYVLTRTVLPRMFAVFDGAQVEAAAAAKVADLANRDSEAIQLVMAQLDEHGPATDPSQLQRALTAATPALRPQVFMLAEAQRRTTWRDPATKARMTRTVPIFRALTEIDPASHRHWGELGFALKDQTSPDRTGAITALDNAISRRGDAAHHGWELYEFGRALARAGLLGSSPLEDAATTEAAIKQDLAVAMRSDWIRRKVAEAQRRIADRGEAVDYADLEIERLKPFLPKS